MKKLLPFTLFFLSLLSAYSQEISSNEKEVNSILNELFEEDELLDQLLQTFSEYQFLYVSMNLNSSTYFSGRDIGLEQYNVVPQVSYVHSNGLYASLSGIYYSEFEPKWDVTTASIGIGKNLDKKKLTRAFLGYSKYFYANDFDNLYSNALSLGFTIRNSKKSIGTQLSGSYLFGEDESYQIVWGNYASIPLVKSKKSNVIFRPELNFIAGQQTIELSRVSIQDDTPTTDYIENDVFELINVQFRAPIQYNVNSFDFELGYNINFPNAIGDEENLKVTGFLNFSMAYLIEL